MFHFGIEVVLCLIKAIVTAYDVCTLPLYTVFQKPWKNWKNPKRCFGIQLDRDDPGSPCVKAETSRVDRLLGIRTMDELMKASFRMYSDRPCLGTRPVLGECEEENSGKVLKKLLLGDYQWLTFKDVDYKVDLVSRGLMAVGSSSRGYLAILAETRQEWIFTALACFRVNLPLVTLYATLGEDAIIHALNDTEVSHLVTSYDLMPKIANIVRKTPSITHVIYMESPTSKMLVQVPERVNVISFSELERHGKTTGASIKGETSTENDTAVIMYTSGATGMPKGVVLTHKNIVSTLKGLSINFQQEGASNNDAYIAYLPLAHIMELLIECLSMGLGAKVGFSSPLTLTDRSTGLQPGCAGDATLLQPTVVVCPPLILDRIRKSITEMVAAKGPLASRLFDYALAYKRFWTRLGFNTSILNMIVFNKLRALLGGRFTTIGTASAPLSVETDAFIRTSLGCDLAGGYGLTETAGSATLKDLDDRSFGRVGSPILGCHVKLVNWDEGNYHVTDEPHPRGEIVVGGDCVSQGYFKNEDLTKEYFREEDGMRWFYTGDIGELYPDGTFSIIDRKKDLLKLQHGEYVALGKIETELKTCGLVDNICVHGNSYQTYLIALVAPNVKQLTNMALQKGKGNMSFKELCKDAAICKAVADAIAELGRRVHLQKTEIPAKIKLCAEDWQPDTGLVTAAYKIRRREIYNFYRNEINEMYSTNRLPK
ncbi:unnamed protein product [Ixodes hexagonus]